MDVSKLNALKNANDIVKGQKLPPCAVLARKQFEKQEAEKLALIEIAVERGKRAAKAEDIAGVVRAANDGVRRIEKRLKKPRRQPKPKREQKGFRMIVVYKALEKKLRAYSNKGYPHYDQTIALQELRSVKKYKKIIGIMKNNSVLRGFRKWKYDPLRMRTD